MWLLWFPAFGTWWWLLTVTALLFLIMFEENDFAGGAFLVLMTYFAITIIFGDFLWILTWIGNHPGKMTFSFVIGTGYVFGYFILGLPWVSFWWWWVQSEKREEYNTHRRQFLKDKGLISDGEDERIRIPDEYLSEWKRIYVGSGHYAPGLRTFWYRNHKRLTCAMMWWPIHMGVFFFQDFLRTFWKRLLNMCKFIFEKIDEIIWGDVSDDFRKLPPELDPHYRGPTR